jgi:hypothetical protein
MSQFIHIVTSLIISRWFNGETINEKGSYARINDTI